MLKSTYHKIFQTIKYLQMKKASRPDQIPNKILKVIACEICRFLEQIFNDLLALSHYLSYFKESITVILHKISGNQDYTRLKNYQPISLLNILSKIIEIILATRISYIVTAYNLLFKTHFESQ